MAIHVVPLGDKRGGEPFEHEEETTCPCFPKVEFHPGMLVIHSAFDGRETVEDPSAPVGESAKELLGGKYDENERPS